MRGKYILRDSMSPQTIVSKALWKQSIKPGSKLFMSIEVPQQQERSGRCRLSGCEGRLEDNGEHIKCQTCAFECFFLKTSSTPEAGPVRKLITENLHMDGQEEDWKKFKHVYQPMEMESNVPTRSHDVEEDGASFIHPQADRYSDFRLQDNTAGFGDRYDSFWDCVSCLPSELTVLNPH